MSVVTSLIIVTPGVSGFIFVTCIAIVVPAISATTSSNAGSISVRAFLVIGIMFNLMFKNIVSIILFVYFVLYFYFIISIHKDNSLEIEN
ncbi:hypothetical protein JCM14467A_25170 [Vulcanisaeta sp. JCM 14467]